MIWAETRTRTIERKEGGALGVTAHPGPRPIWRRGRPALVVLGLEAVEAWVDPHERSQRGRGFLASLDVEEQTEEARHRAASGDAGRGGGWGSMDSGDVGSRGGQGAMAVERQRRRNLGRRRWGRGPAGGIRLGTGKGGGGGALLRRAGYEVVGALFSWRHGWELLRDRDKRKSEVRGRES